MTFFEYQMYHILRCLSSLDNLTQIKGLEKDLAYLHHVLFGIERSLAHENLDFVIWMMDQIVNDSRNPHLRLSSIFSIDFLSKLYPIFFFNLPAVGLGDGSNKQHRLQNKHAQFKSELNWEEEIEYFWETIKRDLVCISPAF
ncbi:hypothetical protein ACJX0J_019466 [Zea mays]